MESAYADAHYDRRLYSANISIVLNAVTMITYKSVTENRDI